MEKLLIGYVKNMITDRSFYLEKYAVGERIIPLQINSIKFL